MMESKERSGLLLVAGGLGVVVFAVLLVGLTTAGGAVDWVSIITAVAGLVMVITGLYRAFRRHTPTAT